VLAEREDMKIYVKPFEYNKWQTWFAWHPVSIGDYIVWLEPIERMGEYDMDGVCWNYRWIPPTMGQ